MALRRMLVAADIEMRTMTYILTRPTVSGCVRPVRRSWWSPAILICLRLTLPSPCTPILLDEPADLKLGPTISGSNGPPLWRFCVFGAFTNVHHYGVILLQVICCHTNPGWSISSRSRSRPTRPAAMATQRNVTEIQTAGHVPAGSIRGAKGLSPAGDTAAAWHHYRRRVVNMPPTVPAWIPSGSRTVLVLQTRRIRVKCRLFIRLNINPEDKALPQAGAWREA